MTVGVDTGMVKDGNNYSSRRPSRTRIRGQRNKHSKGRTRASKRHKFI